jgi:hypothetical protein
MAATHRPAAFALLDLDGTPTDSQNAFRGWAAFFAAASRDPPPAEGAGSRAGSRRRKVICLTGRPECCQSAPGSVTAPACDQAPHPASQAAFSGMA